MDSITLPVMIGEDRRLIIDLPADVPVGPAEVTIKSHAKPPADVENPAREAARAKLLAAGRLVVDLGISDDDELISDEELDELGRMTPGARPSEDLIDEDRGDY